MDMSGVSFSPCLMSDDHYCQMTRMVMLLHWAQFFYALRLSHVVA